MMGIAPTAVVLFLSCFLLINASPARDNGVIPEEVSLRLIRHQSDHRVRRDAGESAMPDVLVMQFPLKGENVILRLRRSRYPPVFTVEKDGLREITGLDDDSTSVYSDPSRGASFMVKKSTDGQFLLDGNLHHHGNQVDMKPAARTKRATGDVNTHTVMIAVPDVIEFENDDSDPEQPKREVEDSRSKRQATVVQHTVETAFVIDHTDFAAFQARFPANTLAEIRNYYTYIALTLNNIYASVVGVDPTIDIKVPVTALYIVQSAANAVIVDADRQLEGSAYLNAFIAWIPTQPGLPNSDHYMAFTAYDIVFNGGGAVGVAEAAQVCTARSVSVVENAFQSDVAHIAAHELGHTLSAEHDGESTGIACPSNLQNVMTPSIFVPTQSPAIPRNIFRFSACSVAAFKTYLAGTTCTLAAATSAAVALPFTDFNYLLITNRDRQCQEAINDARSSYCDPANFANFEEADICIGMLCALPAQPGGQCRFVLPLEGTSCGTNRICSRGLCEVASTVVQAAQTFENPTAAPVTPAPVTPAPVTPAPVTQAPVTQAPVTQAPVTQAPVTQAPVTQAPVTQAPVTQAPVTQAPVTQAPVTQAPVTQAPVTQAPVTQAPVTQAPVTQAPVTQAPVTQAPITQAPITQAPVTQAPITQAPTTFAPATQAPTTFGPAPAPSPSFGLPLGCTRCVLRTYYICLRYYYYSVWYRYRLSPCCQACLIFWRGYNG